MGMRASSPSPTYSNFLPVKNIANHYRRLGMSDLYVSAVAVAVVKKTSATKGITQIVHRKVDGQREYDRLLSIVEGRPF